MKDHHRQRPPGEVSHRGKMIKHQDCSPEKKKNESQRTPSQHGDHSNKQVSKRQQHPKTLHGRNQQGQTKTKVPKAPQTAGRCDNVRVEKGPRLHLENSKVGNQLMQAITANKMAAPQLGPQRQINSWIRLGAYKWFQQAIKTASKRHCTKYLPQANLSI